MDSSDCENSSLLSDQRNDLTRAFANTVSTLFFLIIVFLAFKSMIQCIRRGSSNQTGLPVQQQQTCSSSPEAAAALLAAIPVIIYEPESKTFDDCENCSICLDGFEYGDTVKVLPRCKHMFHKDCIDEWLPSRSIFCPVCRDRTIGEDNKGENANENGRINNCSRNNVSTGNNADSSSSSSSSSASPPVIIILSNIPL